MAAGLIGSPPGVSAATTVIGTVKDASGTVLSSGTIIFTLSQEGTVTDPALLITPPVTCTITAGVIGTCSLRGNDEISPAGTVYRVRIISSGGRTFLPERTYSITGATWDIGTQTPNPSSVQSGIHGASLHSGDVIPPANQEFGAFYSDFAQIAAPANPASGTRRVFVDSATGELSVRTSAGSTVSLEAAGGGGSGDITSVGDCATGACFQSVPANQVFAAPDGAAGQAAFRALVDADLPSTNALDSELHAQSHVLATTAGLGADHTTSGLTAGQVLRATAAGAAAFQSIQDGDLPASIARDSELHAQSHVLDGADHTVSGLTIGNYLRALTASTFGFSVILDGDLPASIARDSELHAQSHVLAGSDHTASGLTIGNVIRATSATAFAWQQLGFSDLGGSATDAQIPDTISIANLTQVATRNHSDLQSIAAGDHHTAGAGLAFSASVLNTASQEAGFLADGAAISLTCGVSNQGKTQVMDNGDLEFCDGATTSVLQKALTESDQNAGTDITADLEEEAHASEHQHAGGDEVATATAAANAIPKANASADLDPAWVVTGAVTTSRCLRTDGSGNIVVHTGDCAAAGGGHTITVNCVALASATAADFDDALPAAPANGFNVKWQKDALDPTNISAYFDTTTYATTTVGSGSTIVETWNVGVTDPVWTIATGVMNLSTGTLQQGGNTVELQSNKNAVSGYAGLDGSSKLTASQGQEVWALADLTDVASTTGSGTVSVLGTNPTLTDVTIDDVAEFVENAGDPPCAAGNYNIKGNSSTGKMRGCENGTLFDLNTAGGSSHDILSATHSDTTAAAVVRGDLMVGQTATPVWQRLAIGGADTFLGSDGTDATWTSVALNVIAAAAGSNTINNGDNAQVWNWSLTTADKVAFKITENVASVATGNPVFLNVATLAASTAHPFQVTSRGTANGVRVGATDGVLIALGTGGLDWPALLNYPAGCTNQFVRTIADTPTCGTVGTADIAGNAADNTIIRDSSGFSVIGKTATGTGDPADIVAADETVLGRTAAGNLVFAQVATGQVANNAITDALLRDSAATSIIGRSAGTTGDPADIAASLDGQVLRRAAGALGFGSLDLADTDAVTGLLPDANIAASISRDTEAPGAGDIGGSLSAGYTINAGAVASAKLATANKTFKCNFTLVRDTGLKDSDDWDTVSNCSRPGRAITITEVIAETDAGSPVINLQRDDGTPANLLSSNCPATTGGATCTIALTEDNFAATDKLDFVAVSGMSGANRVSILIEYTVD